MSVTSYKLADGSTRWKVRYRNAQRKQKEMPGFLTKKRAEFWEAENVTVARQRGTFIDPKDGRTPVADIAAKWLEARDVEATTDARTKNILEVHILPRWGGVAVGAVRNSDVQIWVKGLGKTRAPRTVRKIYQQLTMIMRQAKVDGYITVNPCDDVRLPREDANPKARRALDAPVLADLLASQYVAGHPNRAGIILMMAGLGLRWSEVAGLRVRNIDLVERLVTVEETVVEVDKVGLVRKPYPKNGKHRFTEIPRSVVEPLRFALSGKRPDDIAFASERAGVEMRRRTVKRAWLDKAVVDAAAPPDYTWHEFRHTYASLAQAYGADRAHLADSIGHNSMEVLDAYTHAIRRPGKSVAEAMDRALGNG